MSGAGVVLTMFGVVLAVFGVVLLVGVFGLDPEASTLAGMILSPLGGVFAIAGVYVVVRARRKAYLLAEGIDGKAKIIQFWVFARSDDTVRYTENCDFELEVTVPGRPSYKVDHSQPTPVEVINQLSEGMTLPVKVHPEKPKQLLLVWG